MVVKPNKPTKKNPKSYFVGEFKITTRYAASAWQGKQAGQARALFKYAKKSTSSRVVGLIVFKGGRSSDRTKLKRVVKRLGGGVVIVSILR